MIKFTAPEDRVVGSTTSRVTEKVNEKQILQLLREARAYTYTILAEKTSLSRKSVSLKIKALKEKGIIERIGSD